MTDATRELERTVPTEAERAEALLAAAAGSEATVPATTGAEVSAEPPTPAEPPASAGESPPVVEPAPGPVVEPAPKPDPAPAAEEPPKKSDAKADDKPEDKPEEKKPTPKAKLTLKSLRLTLYHSLVPARGGARRRMVQLQGELVVPKQSNVIGATNQLTLDKIVSDTGEDLLAKHDLARLRQPGFLHGVVSRQSFRSLLTSSGNQWRTSMYGNITLQDQSPIGIKEVLVSADVLKAKTRKMVNVEPVAPGGLLEVAENMSLQIIHMETKQFMMLL